MPAQVSCAITLISYLELRTGKRKEGFHSEGNNSERDDAKMQALIRSTSKLRSLAINQAVVKRSNALFSSSGLPGKFFFFSYFLLSVFSFLFNFSQSIAEKILGYQTNDSVLRLLSLFSVTQFWFFWWLSCFSAFDVWLKWGLAMLKQFQNVIPFLFYFDASLRRV